MKNLLLPGLLLTSFLSFAQCDRDLSLVSSKTEYLDSTGVVQRTVKENSIIEITKSQISITPGSGNAMVGKITSATCNWATPYREGKTIIKADFDDPSNGILHTTLTIEGKNDNVSFMMEIIEMPNRKIRVMIDNFKEKK